jgi:hypothetical protein
MFIYVCFIANNSINATEAFYSTRTVRFVCNSFFSYLLFILCVFCLISGGKINT